MQCCDGRFQIPEWIGVFLILLFNGTFYMDFKGKMFVADAYQATGQLDDVSGFAL